MSEIHPAKTTFFTDQGYKLKGIVHVGAHDGQEIPWYLHMGHTPVLCFEPQPAAVARLVERYGANPAVGIVEAALGETSGTAELWIPRLLHDASDDEQSASFLRADRDSSYDWGERDLEGRLIEVRVLRFDEWARDWLSPSVSLNEFNTLVVDVQGFELQVLRGFGDYLDHFDFLSIECSTVPIYKGGAPASEVAAFLAERGFRQMSPLVDHDDVAFIHEAVA